MQGSKLNLLMGGRKGAPRAWRCWRTPWALARRSWRYKVNPRLMLTNPVYPLLFELTGKPLTAAGTEWLLTHCTGIQIWLVTTMTIGSNAFPGWNSNGIMPPNDPDAPTETAQSPYIVSLLELTARLGSTEPRYVLLRGLLDFRAALHSAGLPQGFQ